MTDQPVSVNVPSDVIRPVIQAHVEAAIIAALGDQSELVAKAVSVILGSRVDEHGKPSSYSDAVPYMTWLARNMVREAATEAMKAWIASHKPQLEKALLAAMKASMGRTARALCDSIGRTAAEHWRVKVDVTFPRDKE